MEERIRPIEYPLESGFPFIVLKDIQVGNKMRVSAVEEIVACAPVDVDEGKGLYFNTVHEMRGKIFLRTMMGSRSMMDKGVWAYAAEDLRELDSQDPNYEIAKGLLKKFS